MKRYIFLTSGIRNMGGAQMYVANKSAYYESLGWETSVFFYTDGKIIINYLQRFSNNLIPELGNNIWSLSKNKRDKVIEQLTNQISENDEVVIESNLLSLAYWGELIAEIIKGKHVVYILQETIPQLTIEQAKFLDFKLKRKELLNSHSLSLHNIFKKHFKSDYDTYNYQLVPYCSNVIDYTHTDIPSTLINADYKIMSVGRLDKEYIRPMLDEIKIFTQKYKDKTFSLIFIGDDNSRTMGKYIKDLYASTKNVSLSLLGYIFPIPFDWIKIVDISIASSNSVLVTSESGIPTISIDGRDLKAIGIYGHTTMSKVFRKENEPVLDISSLMEDVLIKKKYLKNLKGNNVENELGQHFSPHAKLLEISSKEKLYYPVLEVYSIFSRIGFMTKRIIRNLK
ncbi:MAG: glycosyltransferase [Alistipes sp.]|nr:glycosyltransferase [Alistipes sp.]